MNDVERAYREGSLVSVVAVCAFGCFMLVAGPMQAAAQIVYVDISAPVGGDGTSWNSAFRHIQTGIAQLIPGGHEVWVAGGIYPEAITMRSDVEVYGGLTAGAIGRGGTPTAVSLIDGSTAGPGGDPAEHVVTFSNTTGARLDGFTVTGGQANGSDLAGRMGGGVFATGSSADNVVANCEITGNSGGVGGGGFGLLYGGNLTVEDTRIVGNTVTNQGGGVHSYLSNAVFRRCVIASNTAAGSGGALFLNSTSGRYENCLIYGNTALYGSVADIATNWPNSPVPSIPLFVNCTFSRNTDVRTSQGALWLRANVEGWFVNCVFEGHTVAIREDLSLVGEAHPIFCLFDGNGVDLYDRVARGLSGAVQLNALPDVWENVDGPVGFVDPPANDYHLTAGESNALGLGTLRGAPDNDLDGTTRPLPSGTNPDMGCYEEETTAVPAELVGFSVE